jgi:hypothetical protein
MEHEGDTQVSSSDESDSQNQETDVTNPGQVTPTGLIGGVIQLGYTYTPCVDCFIGVPEIDSFAAASFHTPQGTSWYEWLPARGTCSTPSGPNVNPFTYYDVGNTIQLISSPVRDALSRFMESGKPVYRSGQLASSGFVFGGDYSLSVGPNSTLSDFEIPGMVSAPLMFTHLQPSQFFTPDPTYAFSGVLRRSYVNQFSYVPSGDSDLFILTIDVYDETGAYYLGGIMCVESDSGSLTVPAGSLNSFPAYSLASVTFYKWRVSSGVIPSNGATIEGVGQLGVVGTAILQ